jgi:hypothetical protein
MILFNRGPSNAGYLFWTLLAPLIVTDGFQDTYYHIQATTAITTYLVSRVDNNDSAMLLNAPPEHHSLV